MEKKERGREKVAGNREEEEWRDESRGERREWE